MKKFIFQILPLIFSALIFLVFIPEIWVLGIAFGVVGLFIGLNQLKNSQNKILPLVCVIIAIAGALSFIVYMLTTGKTAL